MAVTSLLMPPEEEGGDKIFIQFHTHEYDSGTYCELHVCEPGFRNPQLARRIARKDSEEAYHKEVREESAEKEHLITSHSTNPEWNPEGYVKNLSPEDGGYSEDNNPEGGSEES